MEKESSSMSTSLHFKDIELEQWVACFSLVVLTIQGHTYNKTARRYETHDERLVKKLFDAVIQFGIPAFCFYDLCVLLKLTKLLPAFHAIGRVVFLRACAVAYYHLAGFSDEHRIDAVMVTIYGVLTPLVDAFIGVYDTYYNLQGDGIDQFCRLTGPLHTPFVIHASVWFIYENSPKNARWMTISLALVMVGAILHFLGFDQCYNLPWGANLVQQLGSSDVMVKMLGHMSIAVNFGMTARWILNVRSPHEETS
mmetsp:Transcript_4711/g.8974  ORF Transcript_4711/g.8974 Transcript_4711/m.8974 type:complete len:253 (+) Transcript_4711:150-908(+)